MTPGTAFVARHCAHSFHVYVHTIHMEDRLVCLFPWSCTRSWPIRTLFRIIYLIIYLFASKIIWLCWFRASTDDLHAFLIWRDVLCLIFFSWRGMLQEGMHMGEKHRANERSLILQNVIFREFSFIFIVIVISSLKGTEEIQLVLKGKFRSLSKHI